MRRFLIFVLSLTTLFGISMAIVFHDALEFYLRRIVDPSITSEEMMLLTVLRSEPSTIFQTYNAYLTDHPERIIDCHGILHRIGHEAFEHLGWDEAMGIARPLCGGGYIHGVIEAKFGILADLNPSSIDKEIAAACGDANNEVCYHGIGHGLMVLYHNTISQSLRACEAAPLPGRIDCYDGVFMHVFDAEETGIDKDIPERALGVRLCEHVDVEQQASCQFYAPRIFARTPSMVHDAVALCQGIDHAENAKACAVGSGHMFMKYMLPDADAANEACRAFPQLSLRAECNTGVRMYQTLQESTGFTDRL